MRPRPQHLAALGYKQELKREITFMGSVGITLGCMQARARRAVASVRRGNKLGATARLAPPRFFRLTRRKSAPSSPPRWPTP